MERKYRGKDTKVNVTKSNEHFIWDIRKMANFED